MTLWDGMLTWNSETWSPLSTISRDISGARLSELTSTALLKKKVFQYPIY